MIGNSDNTRTIVLKVNGEDAEKKIKHLNDQLEDAKSKKDALDKKYKDGEPWAKKDTQEYLKLTRQVERCERELSKTRATAQEVDDVMHNLDKASPKKLERTLKSLEKSLSRVERGSKDWDELNKSIRKVKAEIKAVNEAQNETMSMSDRFAEWGNKWLGIAQVIETSMQALSGLKESAAGAYEAFLNMEESQVAVKKYTGLSIDAVKELNEEFKKLDTRTPREKLNALAADAGRLGINSKQAIIDFVDAANMINVALGEDLGEDAVKNIGKLAQLFGDDKKMGLKQAMISTGSVINELGQTSSAAEGYIMDFTARLAGMAKIANMTQPQIMALGAVMDQAIVNSEEGSTALMKVLQQIYREPQKIAQAAGMDVKKFTELVKTDANEALLQFATAVSKMGGMEKIAPMLGDLSLTGAGVSKAISTLANNVDKVRASQQQATEAFRTGTSVVNEYNVANNTAKASLEKARDRVNDLRVELGEQLLPIMQSGLSLGSKSLKLTAEAIKFADKHITTLFALAGAIGFWTAAMNLATIKTKSLAAAQTVWNGVTVATQYLMSPLRAALAGISKVFAMVTGSTKAATVAQRQWNLAIKSNPLGVFLTLLTAAIALFWDYNRSAKEAAKATAEDISQMNVLQRVQKKANDSTMDEISRVRKLTDIVNSNAYSYNTRKRALLALQKIVPDFHAALGKELKLTKENTTAIDNYIKHLGNKAKAEAYYEEMVALNKNVADAKRREATKRFDVQSVQAELDNHPEQYKSHKVTTTRYDRHGHAFTTTKETNEALKAKKKELKIQQNALDAIIEEKKKYEHELKMASDEMDKDDKLKKIFNNLVIAGTGGDESTGTEGGGGGLSDEKRKEAAKKVKQHYEVLKLQQRLSYESGLINKKQYEENILRLDAESYKKQRDIFSQNSEEWVTAEKGRLDALKGLRDKGHDVSLKEIDNDIRDKKIMTMEAYRDGEISEKEYQQKLTDIDLEQLKRRADLIGKYAAGSPEAETARQAYEDALLEDQLSKKEEYLQKAKAFEEKYTKLTAEEKKKIEINTLDELIKAGVIAAEKREEYIKEIEERFKNDKEDKGFSLVGGSTDAISASVIDLGTAITNLNDKLSSGKATWQDYASVAIASLGMVTSLTNAASQLMQANIQLETKKIEQRYESEIKAAGGNRKRIAKLEKQKQAEIAKVKNKYASKAMAMEIAGAVAQTAVAAINAYASAAKVAWWLGPVAAAAATAAGMIQIATIKKQHEAQMAGYFEGGYTGGSSYHREAGVVHEGEFVANHQAVANPSLRPVFDIIDMAQRNNRVSSLSVNDLVAAGAVGQSAQTVVVKDEQLMEAIDRLNSNLERGIEAKAVLTGPDGFVRKMEEYNQMIKY